MRCDTFLFPIKPMLFFSFATIYPEQYFFILDFSPQKNTFNLLK